MKQITSCQKYSICGAVLSLVKILIGTDEVNITSYSRLFCRCVVVTFVTLCVVASVVSVETKLDSL